MNEMERNEQLAEAAYDAPFIASGIAAEGIVHEGLVTTAKEDIKAISEEAEKYRERLREERERERRK